MMPTAQAKVTAPRYVLRQHEVDRIQEVVRELAVRHRSIEAPEFLKAVTVYSHELPRDLRATLNDFRLCEPSPGYLIISGFPINQDKIGDTPAHWHLPSAKATTHEEEIALMLLGSLLGDVFGWATQQDGRLVHEVFPIKGHEHEQLGSSSTELLTWHTEDAFHPHRGDYLLLLCLRNVQRAPTTVGSPNTHRVHEAALAHLHECRFTIRPDESHLPKNAPTTSVGMDVSYAHIEAMNQRPEPIPVLFGDREAPYLRIDPYFMDGINDDNPSAAALRSLIEAIDDDIRNVVLEAGDILCLDNYRVVHGRKPFEALFDGRDRWLKRINVTRDLRKSRAARASVESRVIRG